MALTTSDLSLFGLDLRALWVDVSKPWRDVHRWPLLAWLSPSIPIHLLRADGSDAIWVGAIAAKGALKPLRGAAPRGSRFVAVEMPEELVLRRSITVPAMAETEISSATSLEISSVSPFSAGDLVWGYSAQQAAPGAVKVDAVLASRKQIDQYIHTRAPQLQGVDTPEVWVYADAQTPIVISGFGEGRRTRRTNIGRRAGLALLLLSLILLLVIAVTPTAQLRFRAMEAAASFEALQQRIAPLMRQREALVKSTEHLSALQEVIASSVDPLRVLEVVTQALPDDTSLLSLQIQGQKVNLTGQTVNAAALMQRLSALPGLREVKAPSPATRPLGAAKESFTIEFTLEPKVAVPVAPGDAPKSGVPAGAAATAVPAPAASAAGSSAGVPAQPASKTALPTAKLAP